MSISTGFLDAPNLPESFTLTDLQPLSTSALADRAFFLYRRHFSALFLLGLFSQLVPVLIQILIAETGLEKLYIADPLQTLARGLEVSVLFIVSTFFSFGGAFAVTHTVCHICLGQAVSLRASLFTMVRRIVPIAWSFCWLSGILVVPVFLPFFTMILGLELGIYLAPTTFPGMLMIFGAILLAILASLFPLLVAVMRVFLILPVVAMEGVCGGRSVLRSSRLVGFDPGNGFFYWGEMRLSFLLLPLFIIQILFTLLSFGATWIIDFLIGSKDTLSTSTDPAAIPNLVLLSLTSALFFPLTVLMYTLFYFDIRVRRDGFDLEYLASCLLGSNRAKSGS